MEMQVHHCNGVCVCVCVWLSCLECQFGKSDKFIFTCPGACDYKSDWVVVSVLFLVGERTSSGDVSVYNRSKIDCRRLVIGVLCVRIVSPRCQWPHLGDREDVGQRRSEFEEGESL